MNRTVIASAVVATLASVAAPAVAETPPPVAGGTHCSITTPETFNLHDAMTRGFPATITCDGPASVTGDVEIDEYSRKVADYMAEHFAHGYPGVPARFPYRQLAYRFDAAGTKSFRMKMFPWARPVVKKFAPFPVEVNLSVRTANGRWWTFQSVKRPLQR